MEKLLEEEELDALLSDEDESTEDVSTPSSAAATAYDLNFLSHRVNGWHKELDQVDERLAETLAARFLGLLQRPCEMEAAGVLMLRSKEYLDSLGTPTAIEQYTFAQGSSRLMLVLDATLVFSFLELLLGGSGRPCAIGARGFTRAERRVCDLVVKGVIEDLKTTWPELGIETLVPVASDDKPKACSAYAPGDLVMVRRYRFSCDGGKGELQLVLPSKGIDSVLGDSLERSPEQPAVFQGQQLLSVKARVAGRVRGVSVTLEQLLRLRCGDVLPISSPEVVDVTVNNVPKFTAQVGELDGKVGLSLLPTEEAK